MPSSSEENFCCWKDEPLAKMDERRKPKIRDTGTPLSFLAPALFRMERMEYFLMKLLQIEEKVSFFVVK